MKNNTNKHEVRQNIQIRETAEYAVCATSEMTEEN